MLGWFCKPFVELFLFTVSFATNFWAFREAGVVSQWPQGTEFGFNWLTRATGFPSKWSMFSPKPSPDSGWFYIPGKLNDGSVVNLMALGGPLDRSALLDLGTAGQMPDDPFQRPSANYCVQQFASERWRKYMENVNFVSKDDIQLLFGQHICRMWNHLSPDWFTLGLTHQWNETRTEHWVKREDPKGLKSFDIYFYRQVRNYTSFMSG